MIGIRFELNVTWDNVLKDLLNNINYKEFPVIVTDSPYLVVQVFQFLSERIKKYFRIGK